MKLFSIVSLALILLTSARAFADDVQLRSVTVSADASIYVVPDEVILYVGVESFDAQLDEAKTQNDQASAKLLKAIKQLGVEAKYIQSADMEVDIKYRDSVRPSSGIEGYFARRMYSVTLKEVKEFEAAIDAALKNGANRLAGFEFRTTELRKHRDKARAMAIKAAKEKATALARELDCKIGSPRTINENSMGYYGWSGTRWGRNAYMSQSQNTMQNIDSGGQDDGNLPLGKIAVRAQVSTTFDLVP